MTGDYSWVKTALIVLVVMLALWAFASCSGEATKRRSMDAFYDQMGRSPSAWTDQEQQNYADFIDWVGDQ